ncbi:MAG: citrate lyase subunit alpha [Clostridiales bacterium]|jgi:citrate lyase subunit alpha/citrate CoA-transferase|nr:citrate lyase subunit alpha [Clostridiales bacterium]
MNKLAGTLREAIIACGLSDGMTVSFHHHLRDGDQALNQVMAEIAGLGIKGLRLEASSLFAAHAPLIEHINHGVVTSIGTGYMAGPLARAVSEGFLAEPVRFRTHGGRPAAMARGTARVDVAFIAAPAADPCGNLSGIKGPAACGSLGYAMTDARYAGKVVALTDHLLPYPLFPASISEEQVDFVVRLPSIGDPQGIVSGTTRMTRDPVALAIARLAAQAIEHSALLKDGFSFQTGAGGASLAVTQFLKPIMRRLNVKGSFGLGGITGYLVEMLAEGYFDTLLDVQCFDLKAVESIRDNPRHQEISAARYASPLAKSAAVDALDAVVLGALEIDTDFNVNVHVDSNGVIAGGSGGHADAAAGAKLALVAAPLFRARLPIIVDKVRCVSTPGDTVDALITQRGIAVNPRRPELEDRLKRAGLPVFPIGKIKEIAEGYTGIPTPIEPKGKVVGEVEYRDGRVIDVIRAIR